MKNPIVFVRRKYMNILNTARCNLNHFTVAISHEPVSTKTGSCCEQIEKKSKHVWRHVNTCTCVFLYILYYSSVVSSVFCISAHLLPVYPSQHLFNLSVFYRVARVRGWGQGWAAAGKQWKQFQWRGRRADSKAARNQSQSWGPSKKITFWLRLIKDELHGVAVQNNEHFLFIFCFYYF